jgi:hypothetical protein
VTTTEPAPFARASRTIIGIGFFVQLRINNGNPVLF